ncbi:MAG: GNAT family N-acetyltransferase [Prevotella sp.]|nr:GNAT family N-acetyltransferase [Prevotella sp.]
MRWTVLSDNRSIDSRLETEHGLSILFETEHHRVLLDTGASDVFIRNAERMGVDLSGVDCVFISHGHNDHAGGLSHLLNINNRAKIVVSPDALTGRFYSKRGGLHSITTEWPRYMQDRLLLVNETREIADGIHVIARIPLVRPMPKGNQNLFVQDANGDYVHDDFRHELALYADGFLFTGCAHSGIENILAACPGPVNTVVGGFHLLDGYESDQELTELAQRLKANYPNTQFYTSHCTGDGVFEVMRIVMNEQIQQFKCGKHKGGILLLPLRSEEIIAFKEEMQEAFQYGFEAYNKEGGESTNQWQVLPDLDFYQSLEAQGAEAYEAINENGQRVGGAILSISKADRLGELAFLYVKVGVQSKGIGQAIWKTIESMHPEIKVWETCTPYFDRRNIHFYINRCGFHAVEFFNEHYPDPNMPEQFDQEDGLFKFEKRL